MARIVLAQAAELGRQPDFRADSRHLCLAYMAEFDPPRVAPPWMNPYVGEENSGNFGDLAWMLHGAVGGAFGDAANQELSEAFPPKPRHPARHQYGLQIAERRGKILGELSIAGSILTTIAQMTDTETVMNLLRKVPLFASLKDEDKVCIEETEEWRLPAGEMLVEEGKRAEYFFVLLEGEMSVWKKHAEQDVVVARNRPGAFFGEVPLLLGTPYMLSGRAECDCRLIVFPEEAFWKLLRLCPAISGEIFRAMATRLRNIEGSARQQEKLEALGTMSAGLAHELNNPSSAAQRIAVHLGEVIQTIQSVAHRLHHALEHEHWDRLIAVVGEVLKNLSADKHHHSIEESDSEDALTAWLREGGVTDAWQIAPTLVGAGLDTSSTNFSARTSAKERFRRRVAVDRLAAEDSNPA